MVHVPGQIERHPLLIPEAAHQVHGIEVGGGLPDGLLLGVGEVAPGPSPRFGGTGNRPPPRPLERRAPRFSLVFHDAAHPQRTVQGPGQVVLGQVLGPLQDGGGRPEPIVPGQTPTCSMRAPRSPGVLRQLPQLLVHLRLEAHQQAPQDFFPQGGGFFQVVRHHVVDVLYIYQVTLQFFQVFQQRAMAAGANTRWPWGFRKGRLSASRPRCRCWGAERKKSRQSGSAGRSISSKAGRMRSRTFGSLR